MKRLLLMVLVALFAGSCATMSSREQDLISRALDAMGNADALAKVKTIAVKGTTKQWEPEQSIVASGEMRFANESTFEAVGDVASRSARVDWVKNFVYPSTRTFSFSEIITPDAGYVAGIDANNRNKQNLESNPPGHSMSSLRLAATQREFRRASPLLLLEMRRNPDRLSASPDIVVAGASYPAVNYKAASDQTFTVMFDSQTGLPARVRTMDIDNVYGDSTYDLVLSDWRDFGGIKVATSRQYQINGRTIKEFKITNAAFNAPIAADSFAIPAVAKATAAKPATAGVPYQWVLRRQIIGTYLDSENLTFDTRTTSSMRLVEIAPGVQQTAGGGANSLIVEMRDHLIVFDAPVNDWYSNWVIKAAKEKYPGKPIKYLVLTHHHMDHTGGLRAYAAEGATVVVGQGNGEHFRKYLAAPFTLNPDLSSRDLSRTPVMEVADKQVLSDGKREVMAIVIDNPHAKGLMIGYVSDARLGFVTDIWSPGRDPLPAKISQGLASVVNGVKKAGIQPLTFAGGHGSTMPYALLVALAGGQ
jgi:glyoxylase-like metal-dependent hydrolase (beta-lactamase superfamily II)/outer membrane lipoprotein-sorting protein